METFFKNLNIPSKVESNIPNTIESCDPIIKLIYFAGAKTKNRDVVALRVKPQKPLCCKVRRPAVVRSNPRDRVSTRR